ncbi:MAG: phosphotransferase, partial [Gammaproteobacteria bacterium]
MTDCTPRFTLAEAEHIARDSFGLTAAASPLQSERDQNFALTAAAGEKFVLKIAKSDEDKPVLEFQNAALRRV